MTTEAWKAPIKPVVVTMAFVMTPSYCANSAPTPERWLMHPQAFSPQYHDAHIRLNDIHADIAASYLYLALKAGAGALVCTGRGGGLTSRKVSGLDRSGSHQCRLRHCWDS